MHLRAPHAEHDIPTLQTFIRTNPLGLITTAIDSPNHPLLQTSHVPFILNVPSTIDSPSSSTTTNTSTPNLGTLRGHMARANPQVKAMIEELTSRNLPSGGNGSELIREVLILFNAPTAQHYITPKFYTSTKPTTGKVVPTWNYIAVQAYGTLRLYFDSKAPETNEFLDRQLEGLSEHCERGIMGYEDPWEVSDAPEGYLRVMKMGIVGVEVRVERLEGKWKMSQEMGRGDREGVVLGFEGLETERGREVAGCVRVRGEMVDSEREERRTEKEAGQEQE